MKVASELLCSLQEIADLCGVSRQAVQQWDLRFKDFPSPVAVLNDRVRIWDLRTVLEWVDGHRTLNARLSGSVADVCAEYKRTMKQRVKDAK